MLWEEAGACRGGEPRPQGQGQSAGLDRAGTGVSADSEGRGLLLGATLALPSLSGWQALGKAGLDCTRKGLGNQWRGRRGEALMTSMQAHGPHPNQDGGLSKGI